MKLLHEIESLVESLQKGLDQAHTLADLEKLRVDFLGRKGALAALMAQLPSLGPDQRPLFGRVANRVKERLSDLIDSYTNRMEDAANQAYLAGFDPSLPGRKPRTGSLHPVSLAMSEVCSVLQGLGYEVVDGPEIDTDFHCFEALNMPLDHPARDMQDTLYIRNDLVLRTHTSTLQIRTMLQRKPPLAIIGPGKVYRRDSDVTHTPMFHQIEGLLVDRNVTMAGLRGTLTAFLRAVFGENTRVRFRPSFFPFTEPSVEVDMSCTHCQGSGQIKENGQHTACRICKGSGWLEILGGGMVDPAVFEAVGYDPEEFTGFAFGLGVERVAMLKYGTTDLRTNFENDVRFLRQFTA